MNDYMRMQDSIAKLVEPAEISDKVRKLDTSRFIAFFRLRKQMGEIARKLNISQNLQSKKS
jgi:hypothetical protein